MSKTRKQLEAQLTPQKIQAAHLLVLNEWADILGDDSIQKRTMQEIADAVGCSRSTLTGWRTEEHFTAYLNYLAERQLDAMRSKMYTQLVRAAMGGSNGIPSVRALDLYFRHYGLLTDRTEVVTTERELAGKRKTDEEIQREIAELDRMVNGE